MAQVRRNAHPEDVKARVRKTGITLTALGLKAGVPGVTIRACLRAPIPKGNRAVAAYLGCQLHELWPEWYAADGSRRLSKTAGKSSGASGSRHRQNQEAA